MPPWAAATLASSMTSSVSAKLAGTYSSPVENPSAPSRMDWSTSALISSSSSAVGARFSIPITCLRVHVWPEKNPTLGATSSPDANSSSGQGWSPECNDTISDVIPCRRKFSASG